MRTQASSWQPWPVTSIWENNPMNADMPSEAAKLPQWTRTQVTGVVIAKVPPRMEVNFYLLQGQGRNV